ncbi:peptidylprolyl isomerase [Aggregatilinea lenta]|uniref:peptidylprolyl isomerase n=1 Tax=Aggregatilinea lenta TaxID=913108 RepID=UPI000E5BB1A3|nr:peptidylprolyl isomerase [Aggregatilinea lenta]
MRRRFGMWGAIPVVVLLVALLAACGSTSPEDSGVVLIEDGADETLVAQTAWAQQHPTVTAGPSPTASLTPTPYTMPTTAPDVDTTQAITRVGSEEITLEEYQERVRFERWLPLRRLAHQVETQGIEQTLDLTLADNQNTLALFATLADSYSFGVQVQRILVIEAIATQEAIRRGVEIDPTQYDAKMALYLGLQVGDGGQLPPEFDEAYAAFLDEMKTYTGMTEEDFRHLVRAQTLYDELKFIISQEPGAVQSDQVNVGVNVEDILVGSEADAEQVIARLQAGDTMTDIAESFGLTSSSGASSRTIRTDDSTLPRDVRNTVFSADPGDIIGPFELSEGWYVAKVGQPVFDVPQPEDLDAMRQQHFLDWVEAQMDDPDYTVDYDNWVEYTPQEPLPRDVSPLLSEENMVLPASSSTTEDLGLADPQLDAEMDAIETPVGTAAAPETMADATAAATEAAR